MAAMGRRLFHGAVWTFLIKMTGALSALIISSVLAHLLSPDELGAYFLIYSLSIFIGMLARLGMKQPVMKYVSEYLATGRPAQVNGTLVLVFLVVATGSLAVVSALWLGAGQRLLNAFGLSGYEGILPLLMVFTVIVAFQIPVAESFRGFHALRAAILFDFSLGNVLFVVLVLSVAAVIGISGLYQALVLLIAAHLTSLLIAVALLGRWAIRLGGIRLPDWRPIFAMALPVLLTNVTLFVVSNFGLWAAGYFLPKAEVALYGADLKLIQIIALPLVIANMIVQPTIPRLNATNDRESLGKILRGVATATAIPSILAASVFVLAPDVMLRFVFGEGYERGAMALGILAIGQVVNVWVGPCMNVLTLTGYHKTVMAVVLAVGMVAIAAYVTVPLYFGIEGLATVTAAALIVQNLGIWFLVKKRMGIWTHASFRPLYIRKGLSMLWQS